MEVLGLKKGRRVWTTGNVEPRQGLPLLIYSPYSKKYWYRLLDLDHDMSSYRKYISDGNLYILFEDYWKEKIKEEVKKEGMSYYDVNKVRELVLMDELLDKKEHYIGWQTGKRAIQIEIDKVKRKYN